MDAPTPPPHVPVNYLKAGGMGGFSAKCVQLLANCGYHPDDFGSHAQVQANLAQAKEQRRAYEEQCRAEGRTPRPDGPDPHTAMLAQCTSGHLSHDAAYRNPRNSAGQPTQRGDCCANYSPPPADARCYHNDRAPAMPTLEIDQQTGQPVPNSPHRNVSDAEDRQRAAAQNNTPPGSLSSAQLSRNAQHNADLALAESTQARAATNQAHLDAMQARSDALSESMSNQDGTLDGNTAAECVEAYRKAAMQQMRDDLVRDYGENYPATQAARQKELNDARAELARYPQGGRGDERKRRRALEQATSRRDQFPPGSKRWNQENKKVRREQAAVDQIDGRYRAQRRVDTAQREVDNAPCLHAQAQSLMNQGAPPSPPATGFLTPG